jgi:hypothetical protein
MFNSPECVLYVHLLLHLYYVVSKSHVMNDELENISKEAVVTCQEEPREIRIASAPSEIRTQHVLIRVRNFAAIQTGSV